MKKFVAMLLVLSMVLALAGSAMALTLKKNELYKLKADANSYTAAKASKKTKNVAAKGSVVEYLKTCGAYAQVIVNKKAGTKVYFKKCLLAENDTDHDAVWVKWAKGGKGMSTCQKDFLDIKELKGYYLKVIGHTNLRKNNGMKFKSQGVVEKGDLLKMTGKVGFDDRGFVWIQICKGGKKLWISEVYVQHNKDGFIVFYNKCGKKVD